MQIGYLYWEKVLQMKRKRLASVTYKGSVVLNYFKEGGSYPVKVRGSTRILRGNAQNKKVHSLVGLLQQCRRPSHTDGNVQKTRGVDGS